MTGIINQAYYPEKKTIGDLLSMTNPAIIVPDWQRNYSWKPEHVQTFWNDIVAFSDRSGENVTGEYFLGSIVLVRTTDGRLLLLDGQQRLATSTILLSAVRDIISNHNSDIAGWVQTHWLAAVDPTKQIPEHIHKLRLNVYDRDFFARLITEKRNGSWSEPHPEHASHYLIRDAKALLSKELEARISGLTVDASTNWLNRIINVLAHNVTVIATFSDNEASAAEVFETLNDRGIGLSTPDLLRNLVIRLAPASLQQHVVDQWEEVISFDSDTEIKSFLRHFWISKHGDVKSQSLYREVKSTIEAEGITSLDLSNELRDAAVLYRNIKAASIGTEPTNELLNDIRSLGAGASILLPCLLSIFSELEEADQEVAVRAALNIYVRDGIIGGVENSVLENRLHRAARDLRQHKNATAFCYSLVEGALNDDDVRNRFTRLSISQGGARRYILYKIELAKRTTSELTLNPPSKVHVEHIYPQTPQTGQKWSNHAAMINRLGNLTLLDRRINTTIRNGVFSAKKPHYANSEIIMTRELLEIDEWNADRVAVRQANMAGFVASVWPLVI